VEERVREAAKGPKSLGSDVSYKRKRLDDVSVPRYRRGYAWSVSSSNTSPSALYSETAPPLPSVPQHLVDDPVIQAALSEAHAHIKVETPFNVDRLQNMLSDHPNQPLVHSVMKGLREGFWPLDEGDWKTELEDKVENYPCDDIDMDSIRAFQDREIEAGRWSHPVPRLVPGMKVSPLFVIWQHAKPRVITDHSASGLNDGIPREEAKVKYDDMRAFGGCLHRALLDNPGKRLTLFKSDIASAFLNLPVHPIWQLRQIVSVDDILRLVRRFIFGSRAAPRCWCSLSSLICWLGERKLNILSLHVYMDDFFGWDFEGNFVWFHGRYRPQRQVQLLLLWDAISCPYEDKKQEHGSPLKIIGFWVDVNLGTISLSPSSIEDIVSKVQIFVSTPNRQPCLRDWQRLAGHLNWMLNVLPWARPALSELYRKMSGKVHANKGLFLNAQVREDLGWLIDIIPAAIGVRFIDTGLWNNSDADMVVWTDASLKLALSFVYASNGFVYQLNPSASEPKVDIFFLELLAILSAIYHVAHLPQTPRKLLLYTDSLDSVGVFDSLRASEPIHNGPLKAAASLLMRSGIDLRVCHIEGKKNIRADLLSRLLFDEYARLYPSDRVRLFTPPKELLPARWRESF
jgi:hypothetical protein